MSVLPFVHILIIFSIAFMAWKKEDRVLRKYFWPACIVKLLAGVALGLLYTYYYTIGDTFSYFNDGIKLARLARNDIILYLDFLWRGDASYAIWNDLAFQEPRALFLSKIVSLFCLLSAGNYWVIASYFSLLSLLGAWFLCRTLVRFYTDSAPAAALSFLFFPSVVFWTSGLIKESLAMASLFFLSAIALKLWHRDRVKVVQWLLLPVALWLVWRLKYYYLAVFMPVVVTMLVMRLLVASRMPWRSGWVKIIVWFLLFMIPVYTASLIHPNFYPERFLEVIVSNYEAFIAISDPGDAIVYPELRPEGASIVRYAPKAFFSGLFRPFAWESQNLLQAFTALENSALFVLLLASLFTLKSRLSAFNLLTFSVLLYVVLLCIFLSLSTPNFGTLSRYRVGFLPFFVFLVAWCNPILVRIVRFVQR